MNEARPWVVHVRLSAGLQERVLAEIVRRRGSADEITVTEIVEQGVELWLRREQAGVAERATDALEGDWPSRFLANRCTVVEGAVVTSQELYLAYVEWAEARKWVPVSRIAFGRAMRHVGLTSDNGRSNVLIWPDLALREQRGARG